MSKEYYIKSLSYSQLSTFIGNTGEWQNQRLLGIYDNTTTPAKVVGNILHIFMEKYLETGNIDDAIDMANECLYEGSDGNSYSIDISMVGKDFETIKQHFKTKVIDFGKTGSSEAIRKKIRSGLDSILSEEIYWGKAIAQERSMEYEVKDNIGGVQITTPIPLQAITDYIGRTARVMNITVDGELQEIPEGSLFLRDYKFKDKHSEMNSEDPKYIFQAFFNYYCVVNEFGEKPLFMEFREIKTSKNADGSSSHQKVIIPFYGNTFEEYKVYFWRYLAETFERISYIQERDFLFNIFDFLNGNKEWEKQKAYYLGVPVGQLKSKIAMTQKNKIASNVPVMGDMNPLFKNGKNMKSDISLEDLNTIESKIRVAFRNFGIVVKFEKKLDGYAFDQYLFSTARGTKLTRLKDLTLEIMQALEVKKGLRVVPLVKGTKFIGIEIPRGERKFAQLPKLKKGKIPMLPIGINILGEVISIDLSDADTSHVLIAGQSGSGKSWFEQVGVESLKNYGKITIIDPKKVGLLKVKKHANLYLTELEQIAIHLKGVCLSMESEYEILESHGLESIYEYKEKFPKSKVLEEDFIFIDELATISSAIVQRIVVDSKGNDKIEEYDIGREIMGYIAKITNLGRAVGKHLIMATQRPSIKVISGDIKANISCRVCFALATQVDSKVVIDVEGAEELLGKGDMLFMNRGIERLQGFYI